MKRHRPKKYYEQTISPIKPPMKAKVYDKKIKNLRAIMPPPEEEDPENPMDDESEERSADTTKPGRETQISPILYFPKVHPETQNWRCKYTEHELTGYDASGGGGSNWYPQFDLDATAIIFFRPNVPTSFFNNGSTGTAAMTAAKLSYWSYWSAHYNYFTVVNTKVTIDGYTWGFSPTSPITSVPDTVLGEPSWVMFEREYAKVVPVSDLTYQNMERQVRVGRQDWKPCGGQAHNIANVNTRHHSIHMVRNYNHETWKELVDIASDSEDQIWSAVGNTPTRPHYVVIKPMPKWNPQNSIENRRYWIEWEFTVEYDIQFKELDQKLVHGYLNTPTLP